jgi:hypothetical protein
LEHSATDTDRELAAAQLFPVDVTNRFEPAGEACGTVYDEMAACPICQAGAQQIGLLVLNPRRIKRRWDIGATIADELVFSRRAVDLLRAEGITGVDFAPVEDISGVTGVSIEVAHLM